jgi:type IV pilus assembly protein PilN
MRVTLNLATKPWVDTGTQVRHLRKALAGLVIAALLMLLGLHFISRIAAKAQQQKDQLAAQSAKLEQEKQTYENELHEPQNAAVLDRSRFLNEVFAGKSFSWTAVMMDLENVLPAGVQVVSIEPQVMPSSGIVIHLRVNGDRDRAVDLVRNLEKSKRFLTPRLTGESTQAPTGHGLQQVGVTGPASVSFDILADYNPLPPPSPEQMEKLKSERAKSTQAADKGPGNPASPTHKGLSVPTASHSHKDHS